MRSARTTLFLFALAISPVVAAGPCAGFTDVEDTSAFCTNLTWLKNREITLGCTSPTLYCPNDPVSRLQMAAFIHRAAADLIPVIFVYEQVLGIEIVGSGIYACRGGGGGSNTNPQNARIDATIDIVATAGNSAFYVDAVYSLDAGVTWSNSNAHPHRIDTPFAVGNGAVISWPINLGPGNQYHFGLFIRHADGSTANIQSMRCISRSIVTTQNAP